MPSGTKDHGRAGESVRKHMIDAIAGGGQHGLSRSGAQYDEGEEQLQRESPCHGSPANGAAIRREKPCQQQHSCEANQSSQSSQSTLPAIDFMSAYTRPAADAEEIVTLRRPATFATSR